MVHSQELFWNIPGGTYRSEKAIALEGYKRHKSCPDTCDNLYELAVAMLGWVGSWCDRQPSSSHTLCSRACEGTQSIMQVNISTHTYCTGKLSPTTTPTSTPHDRESKGGPFQVTTLSAKNYSDPISSGVNNEVIHHDWSKTCRSGSALAALLRPAVRC